MKNIACVLAIAVAWLAAVQGVSGQEAKPGAERLYVLYCGDIALDDASSFTPGASGPGGLSVTCYLNAQLWIGHELTEVDQRKYAPQYYE